MKTLILKQEPFAAFGTHIASCPTSSISPPPPEIGAPTFWGKTRRLTNESKAKRQTRHLVKRKEKSEATSSFFLPRMLATAEVHVHIRHVQHFRWRMTRCLGAECPHRDVRAPRVDRQTVLAVGLLSGQQEVHSAEHEEVTVRHRHVHPAVHEHRVDVVRVGVPARSLDVTCVERLVTPIRTHTQ